MNIFQKVKSLNYCFYALIVFSSLIIFTGCCPDETNEENSKINQITKKEKNIELVYKRMTSELGIHARTYICLPEGLTKESVEYNLKKAGEDIFKDLKKSETLTVLGLSENCENIENFFVAYSFDKRSGKTEEEVFWHHKGYFIPSLKCVPLKPGTDTELKDEFIYLSETHQMKDEKDLNMRKKITIKESKGVIFGDCREARYKVKGKDKKGKPVEGWIRGIMVKGTHNWCKK